MATNPNSPARIVTRRATFGGQSGDIAGHVVVANRPIVNNAMERQNQLDAFDAMPTENQQNAIDFVEAASNPNIVAGNQLDAVVNVAPAGNLQNATDFAEAAIEPNIVGANQLNVVADVGPAGNQQNAIDFAEAAIETNIVGANRLNAAVGTDIPLQIALSFLCKSKPRKTRKNAAPALRSPPRIKKLEKIVPRQMGVLGFDCLLLFSFFLLLIINFIDIFSYASAISWVQKHRCKFQLDRQN